MIRTLFVIAALFAVTLPGPATADQTDPRLSSLFGRLQTTKDAVEGTALTRRIWGIWYRSGRADIDELVHRGRALMAQAQLKAAVAVFDRVTERAPQFAEGWNRRATVRYLIGDYKGSLADIVRTLALEPRHFGALSGRGLVYLKLGRERDALRAFRDALAVNPHLSSTRINIRLLRERLGDRDI